MLFPSARTARRRPRHTSAPASVVLCALLLLALSAAPANAQVGGTDHSGTGGNHTIQGRLVGPSGRRSDLRLKVRVESSGAGDLYVFSDANGTFRFTGLRPGSYTVTVEGGEEFETGRESVTIDPSTIRTNRGVVGTPFARPITLQIYLRPKREGSNSTTPPGVLNAALAGVPKSAADLYHRGVEAARKNENERAVNLLREAVAQHPNFPLALSEMGFTYLRLKQPAKAAEALSSSLKLSPEDHGTLLAYGRALFDLRRPAEAEEQFRKALKKNSASSWAHFYLGMVLLGRREFEEAERELKAATGSGGQIAMAHYYLGGLYWEMKQYKRAAEELETYLKLVPSAPEAERLRSTIKELRAK